MKEFPPFRLDPGNQCLWQVDTAGNEKRIDLKPKTYDVLRYLVDNPGRLITHDELLDEVWHDSEVQQDVLKGHVLAIRKALGDTAERPRYILTLRKRGYKFIAPVRFDPAPEKQSRPRLGKFVDRTQPLCDLRESLRLARSNLPQLIFVTGEPGIGKTELVERFLEDLANDDSTSVSIGHCIEGYGGIEPHYPVLEALDRLIRQRNGESVVQALKLVAPTWAVQVPGLLSGQTRASLQQQIAASSRDRMVREFCQLLDKLAERRTLVLVLEDLHWSDYSTLDLLSAFARRRSRARVLIIVTYRPGDAAASNHPVRNLSHELMIHKIGTRLPLQPLPPAAVTEFVASTVTGAQAQPLAQLIIEQSGGNPLLMIATLENFIERGLLVRRTDGFKLCAPIADLKVEISANLNQVLESRLAQLNDREQRALVAGSVVGTSFDAATAAPVCGMTDIEFEEICETLVRHDKCISKSGLQEYPDGTVVREYTFKHVLYRRVLYERQGPIRLSQSHRVVCEALERLYPSWALFFRGELGPAFNELEASIAVMRSHGNEYSARNLQLVRGWFRAYIGDYQGAYDDCLAAAGLDASDSASTPTLDVHEYRIYLVVRGAAETGLGNYERAGELFAERDRLCAQAPVSLDWYWRLLAEYETVNLWLAAGKATAAEEHARLLLKLTLQTRERTFQALAWNALAEAQTLQGKAREALESTERALAVVKEHETRLATWRVHATAARAHTMLGNVAEATCARELSARVSGELLSTFPQSHPLRDSFARRIARAQDDVGFRLASEERSWE